MKKIAFLLALVMVIPWLCSCGRKAQTTSIEFPKTTWGMSMEETVNAFGIKKEDIISYDKSGKAPSFSIQGYELFGEITSQIIFNFIDLEDNKNPVFCTAKVIYPENTDMNHVLEEMKEMYGETVSSFRIYEGYQASNDSLLGVQYEESESVKLWAESPIGELIPEKKSDEYRELWKKFQPNLNANNWDTFSQNARTAAVVWSDQEDINMLSFYAYNSVVCNLLNAQLSEQ